MPKRKNEDYKPVPCQVCKGRKRLDVKTGKDSWSEVDCYFCGATGLQ